MFEDMRNSQKSPIKEDRIANLYGLVSRPVTNVTIEVYG